MVALATLIGALFIYSGQDVATAGVTLAAAAASIANFHLMFQGNYFVLSPDAQPFLHCWSLSVEEQFYLLFPACFLMLYRIARPHITRVLAVLSIVSLVFCIVLTYKTPEWAFYMLPTRAWELLAGAVLATSKKHKDLMGRGYGFVQVLGIVLTGVSLFTISEKNFPGFIAILPVLGTVCILGRTLNPDSFAERLLSWGPLVATGRASYSLYLWHWPVFSMVDYRFFQSSSALRLTLKILVSAIATTICYIFVERPSRTFLNHPQRRHLAFAALVLSLLTLIPTGIAVRRANYISATLRDVAAGGLHFNRSAQKGSMVLMGDSNASMYGRMATKFAKEQDLRLTVISVVAGDPLPHSSGEPSPLWLASLNDVKNSRPDLLVFVCNWSKLNGDEDRLKIALKELTPFAHRIILITQPPELPPTATRERIRRGSRPPFVENPEERAQRVHVNEIVKNLNGDKVSVVDIESLFHDAAGGVRFTDSRGNQLYEDRGHLSDLGANFVKDELTRVISPHL